MQRPHGGVRQRALLGTGIQSSGARRQPDAGGLCQALRQTRRRATRSTRKAICEAVSSPTMRFVPTKSVEQQSIAMLHRTRDLLVRQRTMLVNALRGHLAEFGVTTRRAFGACPSCWRWRRRHPLLSCPIWRECVEVIVAQAKDLQRRIAHGGALDCGLAQAERSLAAAGDGPRDRRHHRDRDRRFRDRRNRLQIRPTICSLDRAHAAIERNGRNIHLGRISKAGDRNLRRLLVLGGTSLRARPGASRKPSLGSMPCWRGFQCGSRPWPSRTGNRRALRGRCSAAARSIGARKPPRHEKKGLRGGREQVLESIERVARDDDLMATFETELGKPVYHVAL